MDSKVAVPNFGKALDYKSPRCYAIIGFDGHWYYLSNILNKPDSN
jgi:hypothetical protein